MMNQLKYVLKVSLLEDWGLNGFSKNTGPYGKKREIKTFAILMLFFIFLLSYSVISYSLLLDKKLEQSNNLQALLLIGILFSNFGIMLLATYKMCNGFYNISNNNMLLTLPISISNIVLGKIISLLLVSYLIIIGCIITPALIYYLILKSIPNHYFIFLVIECILMPLIPMLLGSVIGYLINIIKDKISSKGKNRILNITMILIIVFLIFVSYKNRNFLRDIIDGGHMIAYNISRYYLIAVLSTDVLVSLIIYKLLMYIFCEIIAMLILTLFIKHTIKRVKYR